MNCKACFSKIYKERINPANGEPENLCDYCLSIALMAAYDIQSDTPEDILDILEPYRFDED